MESAACSQEAEGNLWSCRITDIGCSEEVLCPTPRVGSGPWGCPGLIWVSSEGESRDLGTHQVMRCMCLTLFHGITFVFLGMTCVYSAWEEYIHVNQDVGGVGRPGWQGCHPARLRVPPGQAHAPWQYRLGPPLSRLALHHCANCCPGMLEKDDVCVEICSHSCRRENVLPFAHSSVFFLVCCFVCAVATNCTTCSPTSFGMQTKNLSVVFAA